MTEKSPSERMAEIWDKGKFSMDPEEAYAAALSRIEDMKVCGSCDHFEEADNEEGSHCGVKCHSVTAREACLFAPSKWELVK
jgi:hypothetical protein